MKKATGQSGFFQIKELTPELRRAIKVAAAMDDMTMEQWVLFAVRKQLTRQNINLEQEG